jgi:hypothetical protein
MLSQNHTAILVVMAEVETSGYAIIDGVIRKVKIFPGGLRRDGRHYVIATPHNPKKAAKSDGPRLLIDPQFVSSSMEELSEKVRHLRADTLQALTKWSNQT